MINLKTVYVDETIYESIKKEFKKYQQTHNELNNSKTDIILVKIEKKSITNVINELSKSKYLKNKFYFLMSKSELEQNKEINNESNHYRYLNEIIKNKRIYILNKDKSEIDSIDMFPTKRLISKKVIPYNSIDEVIEEIYKK